MRRPLENTPPFPAELTHEGPKRNKNAHFHNSPPNARACHRTGYATKHPRPGHSSVSSSARSQLPPPSQRSATPALAFKPTRPARAGSAHAWCPDAGGEGRKEGVSQTRGEGRRGHGTLRASGRTACQRAWFLPPHLSGVGLLDYFRGAATHAGHARGPAPRHSCSPPLCADGGLILGLVPVAVGGAGWGDRVGKETWDACDWHFSCLDRASPPQSFQVSSAYRLSQHLPWDKTRSLPGLGSPNRFLSSFLSAFPISSLLGFPPVPHTQITCRMGRGSLARDEI